MEEDQKIGCAGVGGQRSTTLVSERLTVTPALTLTLNTYSHVYLICSNRRGQARKDALRHGRPIMGTPKKKRQPFSCL